MAHLTRGPMVHLTRGLTVRQHMARINQERHNIQYNVQELDELLLQHMVIAFFVYSKIANNERL